MIEIRPARHSDLTLLRKIAIETSVATFAKFNTPANMEFFLAEAYGIEVMEREWDQSGAAYFLAWDEDVLVGFSRLRLNNEADLYLGRNTLELQRLYVHPGHQGKKIGSLLMQHSLDYALAKDHDWLWLGVWERNYKAQEFYAKWGFEKFSEHVFPMGDDPQIDWLLKKRIKKPL